MRAAALLAVVAVMTGQLAAQNRPQFGDSPLVPVGAPASAASGETTIAPVDLPTSAPTTRPTTLATTTPTTSDSAATDDANDSQPVLLPQPSPAPRASQPVLPTPRPAPQQATAEQAAAIKQYNAGMELFSAGKVLEARAALSAVFLDAQLDAARQDKALAALNDLSQQSLLNANLVASDPYAYMYTIAKGDLLNRVLQREKLNVTAGIISQINRVDAARLRVGQPIKLLRGPAHAVVSKSHFTMDLYLQQSGAARAFLKRVSVGLGKEGGTPLGNWIVTSKTAHARWTPTASMVGQKPIAWGQPGYPLGKEGYWLALSGTDESNRTQSGYGIHGTDEPDSIGKSASHGCIRMGDDDIEFVFSVMAEKISTVLIRP